MSNPYGSSFLHKAVTATEAYYDFNLLCLIPYGCPNPYGSSFLHKAVTATEAYYDFDLLCLIPYGCPNPYGSSFLHKAVTATETYYASNPIKRDLPIQHIAYATYYAILMESPSFRKLRVLQKPTMVITLKHDLPLQYVTYATYPYRHILTHTVLGVNTFDTFEYKNYYSFLP
ncbi:hypothetical protein CDAR_66931 [Caerostris darwini]|uniref:Uncharacterized protein n=1 Tax=Caerostris darwini TaxID=1538125 RepID=A0AAV4QYA1_9ARAC|nr:hypothetical protein CDAR_66931 [Caerostris darwini]